MATFKGGILGPFSGKVGSVIGSIWKGIFVLKGLSLSHTDANTEAQQIQRTKFKLMVQFLRICYSAIEVGFKYLAIGQSAFNAALKANLAVAIKGIFPALEIDYTKVLFADGNLPGAFNPVAVSNIAGKVDFTWDNNTGMGALGTDVATLILYNPILNQCVVEDGSTRAGGSITVTVPDTWSGMQVHTYIFFKNNEKVSKSEHSGLVAVS